MIAPDIGRYLILDDLTVSGRGWYNLKSGKLCCRQLNWRSCFGDLVEASIIFAVLYQVLSYRKLVLPQIKAFRGLKYLCELRPLPQRRPHARSPRRWPRRYHATPHAQAAPAEPSVAAPYQVRR